jgi:hypothetical protein
MSDITRIECLTKTNRKKLGELGGHLIIGTFTWDHKNWTPIHLLEPIVEDRKIK